VTSTEVGSCSFTQRLTAVLLLLWSLGYSRRCLDTATKQQNWFLVGLEKLYLYVVSISTLVRWENLGFSLGERNTLTEVWWRQPSVAHCEQGKPLCRPQICTKMRFEKWYFSFQNGSWLCERVTE
jgi:hypothetical protein